MMLMMITMIMFLLITLILIIINMQISKKIIKNYEKSTPFECGFDPLSSARLPFSMHFYLISIIFLIFDIEIIIFIPMINTFIKNKYLNWFETSMIFILILMLGLYMEWMYGALEWLK